MNCLKTFTILLLLSGCVEVGFRSPQPVKGKELDRIPSEIIQFYTEQTKDSISKKSSQFDVSYLGDEFNKDGVLSEKTILKHWKGRYFLNQKKDSLWYIVMIVPVGKNNYEAYKMDGGNEKTVKILRSITKVDEVYSEKGKLELVIIDPSKSEFKRIMKSDAFEKIDIF